MFGRSTRRKKRMESRRRILEMLADGTIDPAQAEELIDAITDEEPVRTPRRSTGRRTAIAARTGMRLSVDDLTALASHDIDADYVKGMVEAGLPDLKIGRASCRERVCQ